MIPIRDRLMSLCAQSSQTAVASKIGVSDVQLNRFVRGKRSMTIRFLGRLYGAYPEFFPDLQSVATMTAPPDPTEGD